MTKKKEVRKTVPAGKNDNMELTYTQFATNQERTEMLTGEGKEFDNDALLELLGFEKDGNGLKLSTSSHDVERDDKGKVTRRRKGRTILTDNTRDSER